MKAITTFFYRTTMYLLLCSLSGTIILLSAANDKSHLSFDVPSVLSTLPCKDVQSIYQDHDGFMWIATRNGLFQYDGYSLTTFKSNLHHPGMLTSNSIQCMAEDTHHRLWIGTNNGLNCLDRKTGIIRKYSQSELYSLGVSQILVTRKGRILIGTEQGLYEYHEDGHFTSYDRQNTGNVMGKTTIKALIEDDKGHIWIGTWNRDLYRYDPHTETYFHYPHMNAHQSAHILFQDSRKRIWVGTWGHGLQLLHNPYDMEHVSWTTFSADKKRTTSISDDLIYSITEDVNTGALWVGTRSGLSILKAQEKPVFDARFVNYYPSDSDHTILGNEVATLLSDRQGVMWIGMLGAGVNCVHTNQSGFTLNRLSKVKKNLKSNSISSMFLDDKQRLWLGIGSCGFGVLNRSTNQFTHCLQWPELKGREGISSATDFIQSPSTGHILVSVYDGGIYEFDLDAPIGKRLTHYFNTPWMGEPCVLSLHEDKEANLWVGKRAGLAVRLGNGKALSLDSLQLGTCILRNYSVNDIISFKPHEVWIATANGGAMHICGKGDDWHQYTIKAYNIETNGLTSNYVNCVFHDSRGRLWAGTNSSGLALYDTKKQTFLPVHLTWNLPGDQVVSIQEDGQGRLWLGTNSGLISLTVSDDAQSAHFRLYTTTDGLQDNIFNQDAATVADDGELLFGGHQGFNSFYPDRMERYDKESRVAVTDIKVYNQSLASLDEKERLSISAYSPNFTNKLTLNYLQNNFSVEFSALDFFAPERALYSYKLKGFDTDWQYTDATKRFAYYNNLKPGVYTFYLCASNANGVWDSAPVSMQVTILPPPWKTWWAYLIYIGVLCGMASYIYRTVRNRLRLKSALHMREVQKQKSEELNHAKLQFFTNITHELLTPLTILSASVDELKLMAPNYNEQYGVMTNNINRLIRLLQQILEFRKAESGNLQLRVVYDDLDQFIQHKVDSFRPLIRQRNMQMVVKSELSPFMAYFDPDKLDKVLYNLLSNAAKYNRLGETVMVELKCLDEKNIQIVVRDDGPGISKEAQRNLFKRFYEGDYRRFKTIGTGIGLALVHDLVELHHGHIRVESELGQGTAFFITLPVHQSSYSDEEVTEKEEGKMLPQMQMDIVKEAISDEVDNVDLHTNQNVLVQADDRDNIPSVLLVEDNTELLAIMVKLLRYDYRVYTANNGSEAKEVLKQQEISFIVSDVMMPVMDGISFCRYVKTSFENSHIPIILLTAKTKEKDRVEAYESGADAYITKPFSLNVLQARISNLLKTRERHGYDFKKQLVFESKEMKYTSLDEDFLRKAIECVNRHIDDTNFDLSCFLEELHVTKSTCFRKLKSLTGQTYVSFVRNIRMKAACQIMDEKASIGISELAYAVGYNDPRYFSVSFKKEMGLLPREYLNNNGKSANEK